MLDAWTGLAAGDINAGVGPTWPTYDVATDSFLELGDPIAAGAGVRTADCDFWDAH